MTREQILIVTGAHLEAERRHRPLAYHLRERALAILASTEGPTATPDERVLVCSDIWYLNHPALRQRATLSIGGPEVNALTAHLADRLPSLFAIDGELLIQGEASFDTPLACVWGASAETTAKAVSLFESKYLDDFLAAAVGA